MKQNRKEPLSAPSIALAAPAPKAETANSPARHEVNANDIAVHAYYLFLDHGAEHGHDQENWLEAESALKG